MENFVVLIINDTIMAPTMKLQEVRNLFTGILTRAEICEVKNNVGILNGGSCPLEIISSAEFVNKCIINFIVR